MRVVESKEFPGYFFHLSRDIEAERMLEITASPDTQLLKMVNAIRESFGKESVRNDRSQRIEDYLDRDLHHMFFQKIDPKFLEYIRLRGERTQRSGIGVLFAHGTTGEDGRTWLYRDGAVFTPVQRWINRHDRKYAALLLVVCNEDGCDVLVRRTPIFIPDNIVEHGFVSTQDYHYTMLIPGGEEVDDGSIDWHLKNIPEK
ncbi:MAG: hypothetical protein NT003_00060 [Candidatus Magasanikbacteria bacterium]|nr:hypothetical protein [Candidatus Magasanikbacteria bacterium]